jgi:radical SAM superfamily enzyme YgiQ (UPF0313 family)
MNSQGRIILANVLIWKAGTNDGSNGEFGCLGMGILARSAKMVGHEVRVWDGHLMGYKNSDFSMPDILCISSVSQEGEIHPQWIWKEPLTILGGPHAFSYWDKIDYDYIDKVVVGEADGKFNEIISSDERVILLGNRTTDELLAPDYSDFIGKENMGGYSTYISRGCTGNCSFCQSGKAHGKWRKRNLESIKEEFKEIKQYPKVETIHLIDDAFSANVEHAKKFMDFYLTSGLTYKLNIFNVRADQLDTEILGMMKRAGVVNLPIGVESADPTVYRAIGKGESLNDIKEGIRLIQEAGIVPWLNMIIGLPFDTWERTLNSIEWVESIPAPKIVHWFVYSPFRGTRAYKQLVKDGIIEDGYIPPPYGRRYDNLPWESDFETPDFTFEERRKAHLCAYLRTGSPILINSNILKDVLKYNLKGEYIQWLNRAPLNDYIENELPKKKEKEQV